MATAPARDWLAFGKQLRALRNAAGLTRADIAEKMRVHVSSVSGWELGKRLPREALRNKLARLLGCGAAQLYPPSEVPQLSAAMLTDTVKDMPNLLVDCTRRAEKLLRVMRFAAPYATAANVQTAWRKQISERLLEKSLVVERIEIVYELARLKELLANILTYDPQYYQVKIACAGLKQIAPFMGGYIFDNRDILLGAYWTQIPPVGQPGIRLTGEPYATFFNSFWNEVWRREKQVNPRGGHDLSLVQDVAFALGLPRRRWKAFVEEAKHYTVGDGAPPLI